MREHKYRAWDKYKKQMLPVSDISFGDDGRALTVVFQTSPKGKYYHGLVDGENGILMQFTGLKDKQGKDIYEGDILLVRFGKHTVEVRWKVTGFGFFNLGTHQWQLLYVADLKQIEVIGNIYEHPELAAEGMTA